MGIVNIDKILGQGQEQVAKIFVSESVKSPLTAYRISMGSYPSTAEGLRALVEAPGSRADRWRGPYLEGGRLPRDPWDNEYQYRFPGTKNKDGYDIWSLGPDGVESADDIGNW